MSMDGLCLELWERRWGSGVGLLFFFHSLRGLQGLFAGNKVYHGSNIPCNVACVSSISRNVHPRRTSVIDWQNLQNVHWIFQWRGQMSHYFLVSTVIVWFFFFWGGGNSQISRGWSCDWLVANSPNLHPTDKHSRSCLLLASLTQHWALSFTGLQCCIG